MDRGAWQATDHGVPKVLDMIKWLALSLLCFQKAHSLTASCNGLSRILTLANVLSEHIHGGLTFGYGIRCNITEMMPFTLFNRINWFFFFFFFFLVENEDIWCIKTILSKAEREFRRGAVSGMRMKMMGLDTRCAKAYKLQSLCKKHKGNGFHLIHVSY